MTSSKRANPKVLRAQLYKSFLDLAEADAAYKIAERDRLVLELPARDEGYGVENERATPCTAQEFLDQFDQHLAVMAKVFPEQAAAMHDLINKTGKPKMVGQMGKFLTDEAKKLGELESTVFHREFDLKDCIELYEASGEVVYEHILDLKLSRLPQEHQARVKEAMKPGGDLHRSLSACPDIPSFYAFDSGVLAFNENEFEDGQPFHDRVLRFFEEEGITTRHFAGPRSMSFEPNGFQRRLITTDGIFPSLDTPDVNPEQWLPEVKKQVLSLYPSPSQDHVAFLANGE